LASVHVVRGEKQLAEAALRKASTAGRSQQVNPYLRLAELNLTQGKFAEAQASLRNAIATDRVKDHPEQAQQLWRRFPRQLRSASMVSHE